MNKVLIKLYVPMIEAQYDVWIPVNKKIYKVIRLLTKAVCEFSGGYYKPIRMPLLYDKVTASVYDVNLTVKDANIRNGSELVLISEHD
jgi:hypothetical protein